LLDAFGGCLFGLSCMARQINRQGRALARLAVDIDEPVVLFDNAVYRGKPQAGALAKAFG
jgi:hypothetical protein